LYIDELIGRDTVNTLAPASIEALQQGNPNLKGDSVMADFGGADQVMADLAATGVDFDDVTLTLEREGVASFASSFHDALSTLEQRRAEVG
jgi:transaldolase